MPASTSLSPLPPTIDQSQSDIHPPLTYFDTPHDTTLAALHGQSRRGEHHSFSPKSDVDPHENASRIHLQVDTATASSVNLSSTTNTHMRSRQHSPRPVGHLSPSYLAEQSHDMPQREYLVDPYDGTTIGVIMPSTSSLSPDSSSPNRPPSTEPSTFGSREMPRNEELWVHLSRVLDLQSDIARMHMEMEGIGIGKGKGKMGDGRDRRRGIKPGDIQTRPTVLGGPDPGNTEDDDVHEEDVEMDDEETERNRAREEEFAKLADQFEGRKESIDGIMSKLEELSSALTEFHALQAPEIKLPSSRANSLGVTSPHDATPPNIHRTPGSSMPSYITSPFTSPSPPMPAISKAGIWTLPNRGITTGGILPGSISRKQERQAKGNKGDGMLFKSEEVEEPVK